MGFRPIQFDDAAAAIEPLLLQSRRRLIAIDGRMLAGKTTFGRFLAWRFNMPLIERDLFLDGATPRVDDIQRIVELRLACENAVILEGVFALRLLEQIGCPHDFLFYVANDFGRRPSPKDDEFMGYEKRYTPMSWADYTVSWSF